MAPPTKPLDRCDQCGFDADEWNDQDTVGTLRLASELLALWSAPLDNAEAMNTRPRPDVWSAAEYLDHSREVLFAMRFLVEVAKEEPGRDLGPGVTPSPPGEHRVLDRDRVLDAVAAEAKALAAALADPGHAADDVAAGVIIGGTTHTAAWASRHAVHDLWHHLGDIAAIGTAAGLAAPGQSGVIDQLAASGGGVPKVALERASVTRCGVDGDAQSHRIHHGRPWQALCLWSSDVIAALRAEGHPVVAGGVGENLTVSGIEWSSLHAGLVVEMGDVVARLTAPAVPCSYISGSFADGDSRRIAHDLHPGFARWYASVIEPGELRPGMSITVRAAPVAF